MSGWPVRKLGNVCRVRRGTTITQKQTSAGNVPVVGGGIVPTYYHDTPNRAAGTITISGSGASAGYVNRYAVPIFASDCSTVETGDKSLLLQEFVFRFLQFKQDWINSKLRQGAAQPHVYASDIAEIEIFTPPLEEQQRIVTVLDEAFATIDAASANAEQALMNASGLFESIFNTLLAQGDDWVEMTVAELVESGVLDRPLDGNHGAIHPTKAEFVSSGIPFIMASDLVDGSVDLKGCYFITPERAASLRKGFAKTGDVLISHKGTIGRVAKLENDYGTVVLTPQVTYYRPLQSDKLTTDFLFFALQAPAFQREMCRVAGAGSTRAYIGITAQLALKIRFPAAERQTSIVESLSNLSSEIETLKALYRLKRSALAELKQSLLHRAFTGQLIKASTSATNDNWKTPAFTAQVIALAYRRHLAVGTEATFGRVKAQKALHLCESVGGLDLGRSPVKDAAGPNDFQHMLAAEDWAKANQFFELVPRPSSNGYSFKKLARFDALVAEGADSLKPVQTRLEQAIGLIASMNSEQAELLATVHAAWNNLLLDGVEVTEAAIIHEARENWHVAKQKFGVGKFRQAIATIRAKRIEPDGSAKRVGGQEALLL